MTLDEYQRQAYQTFIQSTKDPFYYMLLGLASETGEVADKVKKALRDNDGYFTIPELAMELGDVLWYVAGIATQLGLSLDDVAALNLKKLSDRVSRGCICGSGDNR
jgi:NTP pyrophosphatase (non-canonical NTP hydrolase)